MIGKVLEEYAAWGVVAIIIASFAAIFWSISAYPIPTVYIGHPSQECIRVVPSNLGTCEDVMTNRLRKYDLMIVDDHYGSE